jgi:hypothetical protein
VRTLVELRLADVSHRFASFPPLDMRDVAQAPLEFGGMGWRAALHTAERAGGDPELAEAIRTSLRRQRHVAADRDGEPRRVSDPRCERLELLTTASVTADERDRLRARVAELEARVAAMQTTRAWRAAARARRARARLGDRLGGGG